MTAKLTSLKKECDVLWDENAVLKQRIAELLVTQQLVTTSAASDCQTSTSAIHLAPDKVAQAPRPSIQSMDWLTDKEQNLDTGVPSQPEVDSIPFGPPQW